MHCGIVVYRKPDNGVGNAAETRRMIAVQGNRQVNLPLPAEQTRRRTAGAVKWKPE
jgi:hypothetical protein